MAGVVLLVVLFAMSWYRAGPAGAGISGWHALSVLRWIILLTAVASIALAFAQARFRAPALPVTLTVLTTVLGLIATIALLVRVPLNPPGALDARPGAYVGLLAAAAAFAGGLMSLRREGRVERDGPGQVPTVSL